MTVRTKVKAGCIGLYNHNQAGAVRRKRGVRVRSSVKAGTIRLPNHNATTVRPR